jgi:hypothetical protein
MVVTVYTVVLWVVPICNLVRKISMYLQNISICQEDNMSQNQKDLNLKTENVCYFSRIYQSKLLENISIFVGFNLPSI